MLIIYVVKVKMKVSQLWPTLCNQTTRVGSQNTGVGSIYLLQGIFPTQGSNPGLPQRPCRLILYQLSHQQSPIYVVRLSKMFFCKYFCKSNSFWKLPLANVTEADRGQHGLVIFSNRTWLGRHYIGKKQRKSWHCHDMKKLDKNCLKSTLVHLSLLQWRITRLLIQ